MTGLVSLLKTQPSYMHKYCPNVRSKKLRVFGVYHNIRYPWPNLLKFEERNYWMLLTSNHDKKDYVQNLPKSKIEGVTKF